MTQTETRETKRQDPVNVPGDKEEAEAQRLYAEAMASARGAVNAADLEMKGVQIEDREQLVGEPFLITDWFTRSGLQSDNSDQDGMPRNREYAVIQAVSPRLGYFWFTIGHARVLSTLARTLNKDGSVRPVHVPHGLAVDRDARRVIGGRIVTWDAYRLS